jgi:threonine/homoserine efflux transporter RhtA
METDVRPTSANEFNSMQNDVPVVALASTIALAAAGTLLAYSLFPAKKRRLSISCQICLGALVAFAGAVTWKNRQEEIDAARNLVDHVNHARDAHWLKKHPVAYA